MNFLIPITHKIKRQSLCTIDDLVREIRFSNILLREQMKGIYNLKELLELFITPKDSFRFDKILTITSAIGANSTITVGSFTVPENMEGMIQKIGLSLPVPGTSGNTTYKLLINSRPVRDWVWTHNPALNIDIGMGKSGIDNPIDMEIPLTGGDIVSFMVTAVAAEASLSYGCRFKGWFKTKDREVNDES